MLKAEPHVFISYSWTSPEHKAVVKEWADRLLEDGIEVMLDIYSLKTGFDKHAYMEKMVTDESITHVLIICDAAYAKKADARKAGVGTETQIISKEVYEKVEQSKFVPLACELNDHGQPYLPTFLASRIWIDFSSPEAVNANWEQLTRLLYGKPLHQKPAKGRAPAYITAEGNDPPSPSMGKLASLKQTILNGRPGIAIYRDDFLDACIGYVDSLRIRTPFETNLKKDIGERILADSNLLKPIRNQIVDWVLLESKTSQSEEFTSSLILFLERLREMKSRPTEISSYSDEYFEGHSVFVYETFLYITAALTKAGAYRTLHEVFTSHYLLPESARTNSKKHDTFVGFYGYSSCLQPVFRPEGPQLFSPAAELIHRHADRTDIPFRALVEAELLAFLMFLLRSDGYWYPGTVHYMGNMLDAPLFTRAIQHKGFKNLATITGISDAEELRTKVGEGFQRWGPEGFRNFYHTSFQELLRVKDWDTLK